VTPITLHDRPSGGVHVHFGDKRIGSVLPCGLHHFEARPLTGHRSTHADADAAIAAVVHAHTGGGYIVQPEVTP
jgi:hypothetical protein